MRKIILILFVFFSIQLFSCGGSEKLATPEEMTHIFIKEYPDMSKIEIYNKTVKYLALATNSFKNAVEYSDKEAGVIITKGKMMVDFGGLMPGPLSFKLSITIKDGKSKYEFLDVLPLDDINFAKYQRLQLVARREFTKLVEDISKYILVKEEF